MMKTLNQSIRQGGIGKGGQEDQASYFSGGNGGYWYPYNPVTKKRRTTV